MFANAFVFHRCDRREKASGERRHLKTPVETDRCRVKEISLVDALALIPLECLLSLLAISRSTYPPLRGLWSCPKGGWLLEREDEGEGEGNAVLPDQASNSVEDREGKRASPPHHPPIISSAATS